MTQAAARSTGRRIAGVATVTAIAIVLAACGSSAPASTAPSAAPSVAAPSVAPSIALPSVAPSIALPSIVLPSVNPGASGGTTGVDPAKDLAIGAPYSLTALPPALQTVFEQQMAAGLGGFGNAIQVGFRQVTGGTGMSILMVIGFPTGFLNAAAYQAALSGMGTSMGATFSTTTVEGVDVSTGTQATGGVAVFHVGDHMLVVISPTPAETLPISTALIKANK
jgi:hypothetical protein